MKIEASDIDELITLLKSKQRLENTIDRVENIDPCSVKLEFYDGLGTPTSFSHCNNVTDVSKFRDLAQLILESDLQDVDVKIEGLIQ